MFARFFPRQFRNESASKPPQGDPGGPETAVSSPTRFFLTTRRYPLFYLPIAKCGCTFVKNLLWQLDHDRVHGDPLDIHAAQSSDLVSARDRSLEDLRASAYGFVVLRDPVERVMSLYFDKVIGPRRFAFFAEHLAQAHDVDVDLPCDAPAAKHRDNLMKLTAFLAANIKGDTKLAVNPHWRPQAARMRRTEGLDFHVIPLPLLDESLPRILGPLIPDIAAQMAAVTTRNAVPRLKGAGEDDAPLATPELRARIDAVYPRDRAMYDHALKARR